MLYGVIGILIVIIIILSIKLGKKIHLDYIELNQLNSLVNDAKQQFEKLSEQKKNLQNNIRSQRDLIEEYQDKILNVQDKYRKELSKKSSDLDKFFENQKITRQSEMNTEFERLRREKEENLRLNINNLIQACTNQEEKIKTNTEKIIAAALESQQAIISETEAQQERFEGLLEPLKKYEMEKQERLYFTIQVPDEYKEDIDFLLNTVSKKVQHPDIINKLVWAEYVKPYIDATFKRAEIRDDPGIYKLTNIENGKCYIGKSTNIKKRIIDHFKSSVGIKTIADQTVHHEILKSGFWNWTIEPIIYCDKDRLGELEKYYINFFKSNEFGYNKTGGGEG